MTLRARKKVRKHEISRIRGEGKR